MSEGLSKMGMAIPRNFLWYSFFFLLGALLATLHPLGLGTNYTPYHWPLSPVHCEQDGPEWTDQLRSSLHRIIIQAWQSILRHSKAFE